MSRVNSLMRKGWRWLLVGRTEVVDRRRSVVELLIVVQEWLMLLLVVVTCGINWLLSTVTARTMAALL